MKGRSEKQISNSQWLFIFLFAAVGMRIFSFFPSVLDHDESTYIVIAHDMFFKGKILYHDVIDTKPPGIFLLFGSIQLFTGQSIFLFRLITALFVGLTAFLIMLSTEKLHSSRSASVASGFIYLFFVSVWKFYGMSPNTELFFAFFNVLGIYLLLQKTPLSLFISGLAFGAGFIIKYSNLFDFVPLVFFLLILNGYKEIKFWARIKNVFITGIGFLLPFAAIHLWYLMNGYFNEFCYYIYHVPLNYSISMDWLGVMYRTLDFHAFFAPVLLMFYYVLFKPAPEYRFLKQLIAVWLFFVGYSILSLGNTFPHYFIQLMLPISMLAGIFFEPAFPRPEFLRRRFVKPVLLTVLLVFVIVKSFTDYMEYYKKPDYAREIAAYLQQNTNESDIIYTGNYHQLIYFLTDKDSPTPYIHWTILFYERLQRVMQIDNQKELEKIFAQKPKYVVIDGELKEPYYQYLKVFLSESYQPEKSFGKKLKIYRMK